HSPNFRLQASHVQSTRQDIAGLQHSSQVVHTELSPEPSRGDRLSEVEDSSGMVAGVAVASRHGLAAIDVEALMSQLRKSATATPEVSVLASAVL
ncbi:unnamed protein product, partial [Plutella xylostella]